MNYVAYIAIGGEEKLRCFDMNPTDGTLTAQETINLGGAPGPLAIDPTQRYLYVGLRSTCQIITFQIEPQTGRLTRFGDPVLLDTDPCYLSTDRTGRFLLAAYYRGGKATVHPIGDAGAVGPTAVCTVETLPYAHCIQTDPTNRFAFLPHVATSNSIFQFHFDAATGQLTPNNPPQVTPEPGVGPRHYVYHPTQNLLYFSNEQGNSVTAYHLDPNQGSLIPFQTLPTLPADFSGPNTCAKIQIDRAGRFLYVSNRGHDSIAGFTVDATGWLTALGQQPTEPTPRAFTLDPSGNFLYASGQGSGKLAAYRINQQSGQLHPLATYPIGERPMWVMVIRN